MSVSFADDDVLAQVVELVFTAESCVKQGFYGVHFRQDGSCNTYLELEDRVSLWVPEVWYCLGWAAFVSAVHQSSDQCFCPAAGSLAPASSVTYCVQFLGFTDM